MYPDQTLLAATEAAPVPGPARSGAGDGVGCVGAGAENAEDSGWEVELSQMLFPSAHLLRQRGEGERQGRKNT